MSHHRTEAARRGREAAAISEAGYYVAPSGRRVELAESIRRAIASTRDWAPDASVPAPRSSARKARISVVNASSLATARAMTKTPMVLNFASAKKPGGGFLSGARAQEESLARSSALYACIAPSPMYEHHRARSDAMYTSWMIHSSRVPIFRDDDDATGRLLEEPWEASFLTAPAPNAKVVLERDPSRREEVDRVMRERARRALAIAAAHGETHLVLGAWGCGVFGNDCAVVADAFARALAGDFAGVFEEVVFAVLDWSPEQRFLRPFEARFGT